jgi:hypothetical protein
MVRMVVTIESDSRFGPVEEEGVAIYTEKTSQHSRLRWHMKRRVEGPL